MLLLFFCFSPHFLLPKKNGVKFRARSLTVPLNGANVVDDMEISVRFRYSTGRPRTLQKFVTNIQNQIVGIVWSKG